jgi:hypothetical protein
VTLGRGGGLKLIAVTSLHIVTFGSSSERDAIWLSGTEIQEVSLKPSRPISYSVNTQLYIIFFKIELRHTFS